MPIAHANGTNIYYKVNGHGEPLILIQGFGGGHEGWFFQVRALKKQFQVITFDSRGIGKSDTPSQSYTIKTMADDTVGLLDCLGMDKAHILGVSLGGIVAQEIAIHYPERVRKLILVNTIAGDFTDINPEVMRSIGVEQGSSKVDYGNIDFYEMMKTVISLSFAKKSYRKFFLPMTLLNVKSVGFTGYRKQMEAAEGHSTIDRLHLIKTPTLVISGTEDRLVPPRCSDEIANRIPNARLVTIEGGSHAVFIEMRNRFNQEVLNHLEKG